MAPRTVRLCACGTRLTRDRRGRTCARCDARAAAALARGPRPVDASFWDTDDVKAALDARHMGRVIRAYRQQPVHGPRGLPQATIGAWVGLTQAQVSRIETGPPIVYLDRLIQWARLLSIPAHLLWFTLPTQVETLPPTAASAEPKTMVGATLETGAPVDRMEIDTGLYYAPSILVTLDTVTGMVEADIHRGEQTSGLAFLLSGLHEPTRNWLLAILDINGPTDGGARVSRAKLDQIRTMLNVFAEADAQQGGGHGRQALAQYMRTTVLPMLRAEPDEAIRRALFDLAGEQAQLLGWMALDTGEHGLAERYLIQALRFSEEAANPVLGAHTLATMSHLATAQGHAEEGVQLARTGQAALKGASPAMLADLSVLEARSLAMRGDARAAATAIHRAERALRDVVTENEPPEMRFIDLAYIAGEIANNLVLLGDAPRAIDFAQQSIDSSLSQGRARRGALSNVALAKARLVQGDLEGATEAGTRALHLARDVDSTRTVEAIQDLTRRLTPHVSAPTVRALLEEVRDAAS